MVAPVTSLMLRGMVPADWLAAIEVVPGSIDFHRIAASLREETRPILPPRHQWFRALELTPIASVRAVILGQDPYPDASLAEGLAFSVPPGAKAPRSLTRILCEARRFATVTEGQRSLAPWALRGVLLLNTALTVPEGVPGGHLRIGWRSFTDAVLLAVAARREPIVFFAWGRHAQDALARVGITDEGSRIVCAAYHPADRRNRFATADPFGKANMRLREQGLDPIDWALS